MRFVTLFYIWAVVIILVACYGQWEHNNTFRIKEGYEVSHISGNGMKTWDKK